MEVVVENDTEALYNVWNEYSNWIRITHHSLNLNLSRHLLEKADAIVEFRQQIMEEEIYQDQKAKGHYRFNLKFPFLIQIFFTLTSLVRVSALGSPAVLVIAFCRGRNRFWEKKNSIAVSFDVYFCKNCNNRDGESQFILSISGQLQALASLSCTFCCYSNWTYKAVVMYVVSITSNTNNRMVFPQLNLLHTTAIF